MAYAYNGAGGPPRPIPPTTLDSLNLYNNALKVYNYYKNKKYERGTDKSVTGDVFDTLDKHAHDWNLLAQNNQEVKVPSGVKSAKNISYRKDFDANRFMQRETAKGMIDTRAPAPLYDRRIFPTKDVSFYNVDKNDPLYEDIVNIKMYDPLLVKPVKALTPQERILRGLGVAPQPVQPKQKQPMLEIKKFVDIVKRRKQYPDIEQIEPKQAIFESNVEIEPNNAKPLHMNQNKGATGGMGFALQYPMLQSSLEKIKSRLMGEPMLPYWVDERGNKRYPAYGENNPEEVRMNRMLMGDLNPKNSEDAMEIQRIKDLLKKKIRLEE